MNAQEKGRMSDRNANLDLLRASAIAFVAVYHVVQMSPQPLSNVARYAHYGQFGVDLFFVLSGWLIGGLYWNEVDRFGKVELPRFWARRLIRTIPPYLVALAISWFAVFWQRGEPFDPGYLIFLQNYYERIPFFLVSWSLCIEEHFYLVVPFLLLIVSRQKSAWVVLFVLLFLMAPVGRYWESLNGISAEFGYGRTASHLRTEGLILGFGLAYLPIFLPNQFATVRRYAPATAAIAATAFVASQFLPFVWNYRIEATALSVGLAGVLVCMVSSKPNRFASSTIVHAVAIASYSAYLTHALVIHAALLLVKQVPSAYWFLYFPLSVTLIVVTAAVFYWLVERTAIQWRDIIIPRRGHANLSVSGAMRRSTADA